MRLGGYYRTEEDGWKFYCLTGPNLRLRHNHCGAHHRISRCSLLILIHETDLNSFMVEISFFMFYKLSGLGIYKIVVGFSAFRLCHKSVPSTPFLIPEPPHLKFQCLPT